MNLRFFRKYNRIIMVVGGSILMVMFLLPNVSMFQPDMRDEVIGTLADGTEVTGYSVANASGEMSLLNQLAGMGVQMLAPPQFQDDPELSWFLLWNEARDHGIYVSQYTAQGVVQSLQESAGLDLSGLLSRNRTTKAAVAQAIQHLLEIRQYLQLTNIKTSFRDPRSGQPTPIRRASEPHLRQIAKDYEAKANVEVVAIDADYLLKDIEEPTQEEIVSRFNQNKEDKDEESRYGFGYYQPDQFKLEYLAVDFESVASSLVKLDEVEMVRYYEDNKSKFVDSEAILNSAEEKEKTEGNEDGERAKPKSLYKPYEEVRDTIIETLRTEHAQKIQTQIIRYISARLNENRRRLQTNNKGYLILPDDYKPLSLKEVALEVQQHEKFKGFLPTYIEINQWQTLENIENLQGFGEATLTVSTRSIPVTNYIQSVHELNDETNSLSTLHLQQHVASSPVEDKNQNQYIFRITDIYKAHVPESIDEADIKQQVIEDVKRLKAYTKLVETHKDKVLNMAQADGLKKVADEYGALIKPITGIKLSDQVEDGLFAEIKSEKYEIVGNSPEFVKAVGHMMEQAEAASDLEKLSKDKQFGVMGIDKNQKLIVYRMTDYSPVTQEQYAGLKPTLPGRLDFLEKAALFERTKNPMLLFNPLPHPSLDELKARAGYTEAEKDEDPDKPNSDTDSDSAKSDETQDRKTDTAKPDQPAGETKSAE